MWWTTPQYHPDTHYRNLTREGSDLGPEGFAPILSFGDLPYEGQFSHGEGFQICFLCFWNVLWDEGFCSGWSANPATHLLIKINPTAGRHPQTQLGT